jgi:hypothetical protein
MASRLARALLILLLAMGPSHLPAQGVQISQNPHSVNTLRHGYGPPSDNLGNNGDFYINTANPANLLIYGRVSAASGPPASRSAAATPARPLASPAPRSMSPGICCSN